MAQSDDEEDNSEGEVDMKSIMKSLALITREYNRGFRRPSYRGKYKREDIGISFEKKPEEEREKRRDEKRNHQRSDGRGGDRSESKGDKNDGCFRCGKLGHFAPECYSKDSRPKSLKDTAYYKKRQNTTLRDLCLLRKMISKQMNPLLMRQTILPSVEWKASTPLILIKRYQHLITPIRLKACFLNSTENFLLLILCIQNY